MEFFGDDAGYPAHLEPGGSDFFSAALMEAALMARVMERARFGEWFGRFLPGAARGEPKNLFTPARVSDRADLQIVHLDGLNLSRAWCMRAIAGAVEDAVLRRVLLESASRHEAAALPHVASGEYAGEHWLATFAVLAVTGDGGGTFSSRGG